MTTTVDAFYGQLQSATKADPALLRDGRRSLYGYFDPADAAILATHYPKVDEELITAIAQMINHPRLLEVAGLVELIERYLEGSYSQLCDVAFRVVSNPLSILFWSERDQAVHRVKAIETELMHGAAEKMALRQGSLCLINILLGRRYGLAITYGCSCCAIAVATTDLPSLYRSNYYRTRETLGRCFDSDVLTTSGGLFEGVSVQEVPAEILGATADFGPPEVASYLRFAAACTDVVARNSVTPTFGGEIEQAKEFLMGVDGPESVAA